MKTYSGSKCLGAYAVTRRVFSKFFAVFILLFFTCGYVLINPSDVSAMANVSSGTGQAWGTTAQIPIRISNASAGETITCTVTVDGTISRCYDSQDHEGSVSGSSATCTLTVSNGNINTIQAWYCIFVTGEDITSISLSRVECGGGSTPSPSPSPSPVPATPSPVPAATTPAPAQTEPAQTQAPAPVQPAADPVAPAVDPGAAPAVDPGAAAPAADSGAVPAADPAAPAADPAAPADAQPVADTTAAPAAQPQQGGNNGGGQANSGNNDSDDEDETEETVETGETEETTVPIVIMDAQGNLITVTPTPTPFPRMNGSTLTFDNTTFNFPFKQVAIYVIIIAVLGTRYFMLKSRGLRGANLALEFVPGVSDIVDKIQRSKGTKIAEAPKTEKNDYSQSTAARAAEAAREAQQARAEYAKAAAERNMAQSSPTAVAGVKTPVKRPASASAARPAASRPASAAGSAKPVPKAKPQEPEGIKMAPGFKFTAPIPGQSWTENPESAASPFKPNASAATSRATEAEVPEAPKKSPFKSTPPSGRSN